MSKGIPLSIMWDVLDKRYRFLARDGDDDISIDWYAYTHCPTKGDISKVWTSLDGDAEYFRIDLPIDAMHDVPWDQTLIERPIPIQEGAFGKFWDEDEEPKDEDATWGYLTNIAEDGTYGDSGVGWVHFIPKIPTHLCINKKE